MGSIDPSPEELTILVTGFGPFKEQYPKNPSWEIASSLPAYLPPERVKDPAAASAVHSEQQAGGLRRPAPPRVRIVVPREPIRVNYQVVREMVPSFWDGKPEDSSSASDGGDDDDNTGGATSVPVGGGAGDTAASASGAPEEDRPGVKNKYDFVLHMGMAGPQPLYQLERRGHRDGYCLRDVDGNLLRDEERHKVEGDKWIWHGVPEEVLTDLDVEAVFKTWVERCPKIEGTTLRISDDPGRYLCDFIYFSSLAHLWKQGRPRDVLFMHVPAFADAPAIALGRELVLQLLRSIVQVHFTGKA